MSELKKLEGKKGKEGIYRRTGFVCRERKKKKGTLFSPSGLLSYDPQKSGDNYKTGGEKKSGELCFRLKKEFLFREYFY